jgi:hypothetical protein
MDEDPCIMNKRVGTPRSIPMESSSSSSIFQFDLDLHGIPFRDDAPSLRHNTNVLNHFLKVSSSPGGSNNRTIIIIVFPAQTTFYFYNGIRALGLTNTMFVIDGTIRFRRRYGDHHATEKDGNHDETAIFRRKDKPLSCFVCKNCNNITMTSDSGNGIIHGGGPEWWGIPLLGYLILQERRPYLLQFNGTDGVWINHIQLIDAPYYHVLLDNVNNSEIHHVHIASRRTHHDTHTLLDISAFNTGTNVCLAFEFEWTTKMIFSINVLTTF